MRPTPFFRHVRGASAGPAASIVRESWTLEAERCRSAVEAALPDPSAELCFNLGPAGRHLSGTAPDGSLPHRAAWVLGPRDRPLYIAKETRDSDVVVLRLQPWAAERTLGVPASELRESFVDLDLFWGGAVEEIRERLSATSNPRERLAIVEQAALRMAARTRATGSPVARALCEAADAHIGSSVAELAARFGLTHRRVIAEFDRAVGLKPKSYQRVRRLRRVFHLVHDYPHLSWTAIAHRCGYYDQAHFIYDFRRLTGIAPSHYATAHGSVGRGFVPHRLA